MMGWMAPLRRLSAKLLVDRISSNGEPSMGEVTTIGLDLAKHVFQVHGVDAEGATVLRKQLRRAQVVGFFSRLPRCVVGMEACGTAHYWARELRALGHEVRLMPAQYAAQMPAAVSLPRPEQSARAESARPPSFQNDSDPSQGPAHRLGGRLSVRGRRVRRCVGPRRHPWQEGHHERAGFRAEAEPG